MTAKQLKDYKEVLESCKKWITESTYINEKIKLEKAIKIAEKNEMLII